MSKWADSAPVPNSPYGHADTGKLGNMPAVIHDQRNYVKHFIGAGNPEREGSRTYFFGTEVPGLTMGQIVYETTFAGMQMGTTQAQEAQMAGPRLINAVYSAIAAFWKRMQGQAERDAANG